MSEVVATWGAKGYPTRMTLTDYKGRRFVDIRKFFGENPTRKGIMLGEDNVEALRAALEESGERIDAWFRGEEADVAERLERMNARLKTTREEANLAPHTTSLTMQSNAGAGLFAVDFQGGTAVIELNRRHPVLESISRAVSDGDEEGVMDAVALILHGMFQTHALSDGSSGEADYEAAERHTHLMGVVLNALVRKER